MTDQVFTNALTVDVEDYFHVSGFTGSISPRDWDSYPSRVVANTERILDLLDRLVAAGREDVDLLVVQDVGEDHEAIALEERNCSLDILWLQDLESSDAIVRLEVLA